MTTTGLICIINSAEGKKPDEDDDSEQLANHVELYINPDGNPDSVLPLLYVAIYNWRRNKLATLDTLGAFIAGVCPDRTEMLQPDQSYDATFRYVLWMRNDSVNPSHKEVTVGVYTPSGNSGWNIIKQGAIEDLLHDPELHQS